MPSSDSFGSLQGKTALVTGASRGIGAAVARELARGGARVAVNYRASKAAAEALADELGGVALAGDVGDAGDAARVVEEAEEALGDLDLLVNNAGITRDTLLARMSDEDWGAVVATNLSGAFYTCRAVARKMLRRRSGAIVNVTSYVGLHGNPGQANYAATKAGLVGFTKALAKELGGRGVRVNAVAPGYITTDITTGLSDEIRAFLLQATALGRLGDPDDVARAVRFLCSDESSYVTGEVLLVDGGLGM
ncbi:MAG: 3-oxoacyl-[acyl-carrier-protein] reductase [Thermoleophilia bacterium]|nr:3-oxoacyl-[acyl-carrier-protein] reductase [Thermoleophilia bacterium]